MRVWRAALLIGMILPAGCAHHVTKPPPAQPVAACQAPEYRYFDFWIGHWNVGPPGEEPRAENRIEPVAGGCALMESYRSDSAYSGRSLNWYQPGVGWRQTWIDNAGLILQLTGGLDAHGDMVLSGSARTAADGASVRDRIRWTPEPGGSVLQVWDISADDGVSWEQIFAGRYLPASD